MNDATFRKLLTARQRDLVDNEYEIKKYAQKLASLQAERADIEKDINGLNRRLLANKTEA